MPRRWRAAAPIRRGCATPMTIPRPNPDLAAGLARALEGGDLQDWLERPGAAGRRISGALQRLSGGPPADRRGATAAGPALLADAAHARGQSRTPPLAGARAGRDPDRRRYRRGDAHLCPRQPARRQPPRRRRPAGQGDAGPCLADRPPGRQPDLDGADARSSGARSSRTAAAIWRATTWNIAAGRSSSRSGPHNSLGLVKFDMRNNHAIYLHDTPAKALFGADERHRSHGCVRVMDALGFARLIAPDEGVLEQWTSAQRRTGTRKARRNIASAASICRARSRSACSITPPMSRTAGW